jgi:hypothetical protein
MHGLGMARRRWEGKIHSDSIEMGEEEKKKDQHCVESGRGEDIRRGEMESIGEAEAEDEADSDEAEDEAADEAEDEAEDEAADEAEAEAED